MADEMEDSQSSASAPSNRVTTPPPLPLAGDQHQAKGCITVLIREMLLKSNYLK